MRVKLDGIHPANLFSKKSCQIKTPALAFHILTNEKFLIMWQVEQKRSYHAYICYLFRLLFQIFPSCDFLFLPLNVNQITRPKQILSIIKMLDPTGDGAAGVGQRPRSRGPAPLCGRANGMSPLLYCSSAFSANSSTPCS